LGQHTSSSFIAEIEKFCKTKKLLYDELVALFVLHEAFNNLTEVGGDWECFLYEIVTRLVTGSDIDVADDMGSRVGTV
jgi:hypothetical protein